MSSSAIRSMCSGWSRANRWATRAPRSCPATAKRSKPSARIVSTWSRANARFECIVRPGGRLGAIAIAAQVGRDDGELGGQARSELAPHQMGLRVAVQQQQRRPATACHQVDAGTRCLDPPGLKARKEVGHWSFPAAPAARPPVIMSALRIAMSRLFVRPDRKSNPRPLRHRAEEGLAFA